MKWATKLNRALEAGAPPHVGLMQCDKLRVSVTYYDQQDKAVRICGIERKARTKKLYNVISKCGSTASGLTRAEAVSRAARETGASAEDINVAIDKL